MTVLDDQPITKPPYDEGPNKEKLPDKPISQEKLSEILQGILQEEETE